MSAEIKSYGAQESKIRDKSTSKLVGTLAAAALFSLSAITACGNSSPEFNDGTITEKNYYQPYSDSYCQPIIIGKMISCIWQTRNMPERFAVEIEHCFPKDPSPPECWRKEVNVDHQNFQDLQIGQYVSFKKNNP